VRTRAASDAEAYRLGVVLGSLRDNAGADRVAETYDTYARVKYYDRLRFVNERLVFFLKTTRARSSRSRER
jgi:hypothetical protein